MMVMLRRLPAAGVNCSCIGASTQAGIYACCRQQELRGRRWYLHRDNDSSTPVRCNECPPLLIAEGLLLIFPQDDSLSPPL